MSYKVKSVEVHATGLRLPTHLGITQNDDLFVSEVAGGAVREITLPGDYGSTKKGLYATGLDRPGGILPRTNGQIWVADTGANEIYDISRSCDVLKSKPKVFEDAPNPYSLIEFKNKVVASYFQKGLVGLIEIEEGKRFGNARVLATEFPCLTSNEPFPAVEAYGGSWATGIKNQRLLFCHTALGTLFDVTAGGDFKALRDKRYAWGLEGPGGMIADPIDDDLYVTEKRTGSVRKITGPGYARFAESLIIGFKEPTCVRFNSTGTKAFVVDRAWGAVYCINIEHVGSDLDSKVTKTSSSKPAPKQERPSAARPSPGGETTISKEAKARKLSVAPHEALLAELRRRETKQASGVTVHTFSVAKQDHSFATGEFTNFSDKDLFSALQTSQKLIYGLDDRKEAYQVTDPAISLLTGGTAAGVVCLLDVSDIQDNGDGTSTIKTVVFGDSHGLCSTERFKDQPTAPFCSGFLVAPDLIATAGHCLDGNNLARTRFVFGFQMKPDGTANDIVSNDHIFSGTGIVARQEDSIGADYCIVRLDRPADGHPVQKVRTSGKIQDRSSVYVIGHPSGLPLKYASNAIVRENSNPDYFVANLDTYGGNSGSPVFNQATHEVEGILVRGDTDFVEVDGCRVSNVCPTTGCRGEDVTRSTAFAQHISTIASEGTIASCEEEEDEEEQLAYPPVIEGGEEEELSIDGRITRLERSVDKILAAINELKPARESSA